MADVQPNMEVDDDERLMMLLGHGRNEALDELMRRHSGRVRQLAYRVLGRWDDADDAVQETFARVLRAASNYRPDAKFTTWLYRISFNSSQDLRRKHYRHAALIDVLRFRKPVVDEETDEREDAVRRVRKAIEGLAEFQRAAVVLHYYERLTCSQIGEIVGKSSAAVESALSRAYATLRRKLGENSEISDCSTGGYRGPERSNT